MIETIRPVYAPLHEKSFAEDEKRITKKKDGSNEERQERRQEADRQPEEQTFPEEKKSETRLSVIA